MNRIIECRWPRRWVNMARTQSADLSGRQRFRSEDAGIGRDNTISDRCSESPKMSPHSTHRGIALRGNRQKPGHFGRIQQRRVQLSTNSTVLWAALHHGGQGRQEGSVSGVRVAGCFDSRPDPGNPNRQIYLGDDDFVGGILRKAKNGLGASLLDLTPGPSLGLAGRVVTLESQELPARA